jgi:hypothetical protein
VDYPPPRDTIRAINLVREWKFKSFVLKRGFSVSLHTMPLGKRKTGAEVAPSQVGKIDGLSYNMCVACDMQDYASVKHVYDRF